MTVDPPDLDEREADLGRYLAVIGRRWYVVLAACVLGLAVTAAVTLRSPRIYEATTTLLVPKEGGRSGMLGGLAASGLLQAVPGLAPPSLTPNRDILVNVLRSRRVAEAIVEQFGLEAGYGVQYPEDAVRRLGQQTTVQPSREGIITIRVEDTDPRKAADMANAYVAQLDVQVLRLSVEEAAQERTFATRQLARATADLAGAEESLRRFQERNRAVVLPDQMRGAIEASARLKGELMAAEAQLEVMRGYATESNPETILLRRRIEEMRKQLSRIQYGETGDGRAARRDFAVPFSRVPEVGLELVRLTREVKAQEALVALLTQQMEQARLTEARTMPTVQVLDRAVPARRHARPVLRLNLLVGGIVSLAVGVALAFAVDGVGQVRRRRKLEFRVP